MTHADVRRSAEAAERAARVLAAASDADRRAVVEGFADELVAQRGAIEAANAKDVAAADEAVAAGTMSRPMADRLPLHGAKFDAAVEGVRAVAALDDPVGRTLRATRLDDGLELRQVTVPIGVLACAFESRPDAAVQIVALALRTGNAVILKGGSEAAATNHAIADAARRALDAAGMPVDTVVMLRDRDELQALLVMDDLVDLMVPRGSNAFVRFVMDNTRIPVLGHADGVCHTYVDASADLASAVSVCVDAKTDYPAACNATECILVHEDVADAFLPALYEAMVGEGVAVRADEAARAVVPDATPATDDDWGREYGDLVVAVRVVPSVAAAVEHVNRYGSGHTDAILTTDEAAADQFVDTVDSAGVYVNASTRFADGYRYGLGAEVGVSTGKVHARGPVGLDGLTTTKWVLRGAGHLAGTYQGADARPFLHEPVDAAGADRDA